MRPGNQCGEGEFQAAARFPFFTFNEMGHHCRNWAREWHELINFESILRCFEKRLQRRNNPGEK